jgi:hypothetical protein
MKKALKYLFIVLINMTVLTTLFILSYDTFEQTFNQWGLLSEPFKILGFSFLSLIGLCLLVIYFRKKGITSVRKKIKLASMLTVLICSFLYVDYLVNIIINNFINKSLRESVLNKVEPAFFNVGTTAYNLSFEEYNQISKSNTLLKIPRNARNISYDHSYDGFHFDYSLTVIYELPLNTNIKEYEIRDGDYSKSLKIEKSENYILVTYTEFQS